MNIYTSDTTEIKYINIYNKNVLNDIKIASLSDVHISDRTTLKELDFICKLLYLNKPNYICLLGDLIDSPSVLKENKFKVIYLLNNLSKIAPIYMILGNHDYINYCKDKLYEEEYNKDFYNEISQINNVNLLIDKIKYLNDLTIMGYLEKYNIYHSRNINSFNFDLSKKENLYKIKKDMPSIALVHSPEPLRYLNNINLLKDYDLILSGHYHNGCLPTFLESLWPVKTGGLVTPSKELFPKDVRGIEKLKTGSILIHNGGWIKIAENTPNYLHFLDKLCNRQLDIITLTKEKNNNKIYTKKINNEY